MSNSFDGRTPGAGEPVNTLQIRMLYCDCRAEDAMARHASLAGRTRGSRVPTPPSCRRTQPSFSCDLARSTVFVFHKRLHALQAARPASTPYACNPRLSACRGLSHDSCLEVQLVFMWRQRPCWPASPSGRPHFACHKLNVATSVLQDASWHLLRYSRPHLARRPLSCHEKQRLTCQVVAR